jgi:hypothetical protein
MDGAPHGHRDAASLIDDNESVPAAASTLARALLIKGTS